MDAGKAAVVAAIITAIATLGASIITVYQPLKSENDALHQQNEELQEQNYALVIESQEENTSVQSSIATFKKRISDLEADNSALQSENFTLQANYDAALDEIDRLKEKLSELISNSTEIAAVSPNNESIETPNVQSYNFVEVMNPYESQGYSKPNTITMMGNTYTSGFMLDFLTSGFALFNLDGTYDMLEFDMGHIDGSAMESASFDVYLDGKFIETIELSPGMRITHTSIPLNHAIQMKIAFSVVAYYPKYGFVNTKIR